MARVHVDDGPFFQAKPKMTWDKAWPMWPLIVSRAATFTVKIGAP